MTNEKSILFSGGSFDGMLFPLRYLEEIPQVVERGYRMLRMLDPNDCLTYTYCLGKGNVARFVGTANDHAVLTGQARSVDKAESEGLIDKQTADFMRDWAQKVAQETEDSIEVDSFLDSIRKEWL